MEFVERVKSYLSFQGFLKPILKEEKECITVGQEDYIFYRVILEKNLDLLLKNVYGENVLGYIIQYPDSEFTEDYCAYIEKDGYKLALSIETDDIPGGNANVSVDNLGEDYSDESEEFKKIAKELSELLISHLSELNQYRLHFTTKNVTATYPENIE